MLFHFLQEENDNDYESESSGHDSIDTDFVDTEEEDEEDGSANDVLDEEKRKRRTRRVITKSYKVNVGIIINVGYTAILLN